MKTILCYGDSNTWGFVPGSYDPQTQFMQRFTCQQRWTGLLQAQLGADFQIIEAGLNGRTTNIDYFLEIVACRNGKTFLSTCLYSHAPIDLVVLMLGVNDLKAEFKRSIADIKQGMAELIQIIQTSSYGPQMSTAPAILLLGNPQMVKEVNDGQFKGAQAKLKLLNQSYKQLANQYGIYFADAGESIEFSPVDGYHLDLRGHELFAQWIYNHIVKILDLTHESF